MIKFIADLYVELWTHKQWGEMVILTMALPFIPIFMWIGMVIGGGQD